MNTIPARPPNRNPVLTFLEGVFRRILLGWEQFRRALPITVLVGLTLAFVWLSGASGVSGKDSTYVLKSESGETAEVTIRKEPSQVTVSFVKGNFDLPNHIEFSYVNEQGVRKTLQLGAIPEHLVDRPSYRGEHRANQESFTGLEIRLPLSRGEKVLKAQER